MAIGPENPNVVDGIDYEDLSRRVHTIARQLVRNRRTSPEDVAQKALISLFTRGNFEPLGGPQTDAYLRRSVIYHSIDEARYQTRRHTVRGEAIASLSHIVDPQDVSLHTPSAEDEVMSRQLTHPVAVAVRQLSETRRAVLIDQIDGLSNDESAEHLDVPPGTVRTRRMRGAKQMRSLIIGHPETTGQQG